MKKRVTFFINIVTIVMTVAAFPLSAQATIMTGNALASLCASDKERDRFSCHSYIAGIIDYHKLMKSLGTAPSVDFCVPDGIKMKQVSTAVLEYLDNNAQHSSFLASPGVTLALFEAFPCKK